MSEHDYQGDDRENEPIETFAESLAESDVPGDLEAGAEDVWSGDVPVDVDVPGELEGEADDIEERSFAGDANMSGGTGAIDSSARPLPADRPPTPAEWGMARLNELGGTLEQARRSVDAAFPPEFREHARVARREFWLAVRSLVDARLAAIDEAGQPKPPAPKPPTSGRVDIE